MYKCENCGTEFESKFCPNCGAPAPLEACPNCGTKLSSTDKFCPECGYALRSAGKQTRSLDYARDDARGNARDDRRDVNNGKREKKAQSASPALVKFLSLLPYATTVLFALFSVLLFLMLLGSVSSVMGMGTGSIYDQLSAGGGSSDGGFSDFFGGGMSEMTGADTVTNICTALVVFAALGAVLAACAVAFRFYVPLRVKKIGNFRVCTLLNAGIFLFYFIDFLLGCILCGTVSDEITSPEAGPVCVLVFALLFGLCSAGAVIVQKFLPKFFPAAAAELERQRAERRAVLTTPAKPEWKELVKPKKPQKPQYHAVECSAKLKESAIKRAKARNLFMVLSGAVFIVFELVCIFMWLIFGGARYIHDGDQKSIDLIPNVLMPLIVCSAVLTIVLGGVFGSLYYKLRTPDYAWQRKRVWSDKAMFWTISAFCFALTFSCTMFSVFNEMFVKDHLDLVRKLLVFICTFPFVITYCVVAYSCAGAITRKGTKLSRAIYGAKRPWLNSELEEQYLTDANDYVSRKQTYIEQKKDYLAERNAQRKVWRKYRRELAYYEEGIALK